MEKVISISKPNISKKEISVEDMQKIVDANEKIVKELKSNERSEF